MDAGFFTPSRRAQCVPWDSVNMQTVLTQNAIPSLSERNVTNGFRKRGNKTPIILSVKEPCCPIQCCLTIPSQYVVLFQKWNKDVTLETGKKAGLVCCWPWYKRVSHVVTKSSISYDAPIANCPTKDNVKVQVDVSFNFQIGPSEENVKKFVYSLGAARFQELLQAETEEAIRTLVFGIPVMSVRDLREEISQSMTSALNRSVNKYGVIIQNIRITDTKLPKELDRTLSQTTEFKSQIDALQKTHSAKMQELTDNEKRENVKQEKHWEREVQEIEAECAKAEINRQHALIQAQSKLEVSVTNARSEAHSKITVAAAQKRDAVTGAEKYKIQEIEKSRYEVKQLLVQADQTLKTKTLEAKAIVAIAKSESDGIKARADAEAVASEQMEEARQHEIQLGRLKTLGKLASSGNMVITGESGERILSLIAPGSGDDKVKVYLGQWMER